VKLNLGCGRDIRTGWVNVDSSPLFGADRIWDLNVTPWPFADSVAEEVLLSHVLEHLGPTAESYLTIIRELYRVCAHGAEVRILLPHPRHDDFLLDPTHVRAILPESFLLFSRSVCERLAAEGAGDTPLALMLGVNFEVQTIQHTLDPAWRERLTKGEITQDGLAEAARQYNNVIKETAVVLKAIKDGKG